MFCYMLLLHTVTYLNPKFQILPLVPTLSLCSWEFTKVPGTACCMHRLVPIQCTGAGTLQARARANHPNQTTLRTPGPQLQPECTTPWPGATWLGKSGEAGPGTDVKPAQPEVREAKLDRESGLGAWTRMMAWLALTVMANVGGNVQAFKAGTPRSTALA